MALPLLLVAGAAGLGLFGAGKTIKAAMDNSEANDLNDSANSIVSNAKNKIDSARKQSGKAFETLGAKKVAILNGSIAKFIDRINQIKNFPFDTSINNGNLKFDAKSFEELKNFTPEIAESIFAATAKTNSAWCIHPLQDYLYMDINYWLPNSKDERVNVPGEVTDFNWTYRIPCLVEELIKNKNLIQKIKVIAEKHDGRK